MSIKFTFLFLMANSFLNYNSGKNVVFKLGDASCTVLIYEKKKSIANLIALHGNESTCIKSFLALPNQCPFVLYELQQLGTRLLKYNYNKLIMLMIIMVLN